MKKLTFSTMAAARLKANKRQYVSLVLGIFLSIFLISTLVLSVYGIYQAELQKRYDKVGFLDMVVLDNPSTTEEIIRSFDEFDRFGHAYISGIVTDKNVYVGYYDQVGLDLMNLKTVDGRLPETAGEIAIEASAMDILDVSWQIGETVELSITPVDGTEETRAFALVGILPERSIYLSISDHNGLSQFPAIVTSPEEPAFAVGRLGTHWLMRLAKHVTLDQAINSFWETIHSSDGNWSVYNDFFGLSITGEQRQYSGLGDVLDADNEMFVMISIVTALAASLILSCGIGISGAMEGVLSKRREEIGVLRALGATRRQIRRMFGRENLILALVVSPLSVAISVLAVWVLSKLLTGSLAFAFNIWLVLPIVLFSVLVIFLSGYLPLARASKLMPMSVIRDTAMLRRSKGVKYKKQFSAPKLIASRQIRFNPTRQIGASLLVGLMLLCSGLLSGFISTYTDYSMVNTAGFYVRADVAYYSGNHIGWWPSESMNKQSISQIRSLSHVESIEIDRVMTVTLLLDNVPRYAFLEPGIGSYEILNDMQYEEAMSLYSGEREYHDRNRQEGRERYLQFLEDYDIPGEAFDVAISTVDLNKKNLELLTPLIESGKIDVDAINAGTQVLVVAPEVWIKPREDGTGYWGWESEEAVRNDPNGKGAYLALWNDTFTAGQQLPIMQLYRTEEDGPVNRIDTSPVVGAVLSDNAGLAKGHLNYVQVITSEQGLENLGLLNQGLREVAVYLDGEVTAQEEEVLERQLSAIARRFDGHYVFNQMENFRQREQANRQQILLFAAIVVVFFSVAVGMMVSSVTRQLNSEGRTIGMLRAVGADEKAILDCYSGQVHACALGGLGISLGLLALYGFFYVYEGIISGRGTIYQPSPSQIRLFLLIAATICVMGLILLLVCKFLLRFRIREIVNKSIIDNIREL